MNETVRVRANQGADVSVRMLLLPPPPLTQPVSFFRPKTRVFVFSPVFALIFTRGRVDYPRFMRQLMLGSELWRRGPGVGRAGHEPAEDGDGGHGDGGYGGSGRPWSAA